MTFAPDVAIALPPPILYVVASEEEPVELALTQVALRG